MIPFPLQKLTPASDMDQVNWAVGAVSLEQAAQVRQFVCRTILMGFRLLRRDYRVCLLCTPWGKALCRRPACTLQIHPESPEEQPSLAPSRQVSTPHLTAGRRSWHMAVVPQMLVLQPATLLPPHASTVAPMDPMVPTATVPMGQTAMAPAQQTAMAWQVTRATRALHRGQTGSLLRHRPPA